MAITLDAQAAWFVDAKDVKCAPSARQLGSGQFGEVLEGSWLSCPVAVKRLYRSLFNRELPVRQGKGQSKKKQLADVVASFSELMARLSAVRHPHIADFYGAATPASDPAPVLLTEQLQRSLLSRRRDTSCPQLTVRDCVDAALEVASALTYLHERSVPMAHGSVSTGNVLLTTAGRCKLTDTGLAGWLLECQDGGGGSEMESSAYMPVNMSKEERLSCAVDVYSLGVVLLEILTTRKDFVAQNPPPLPSPAEATKAAATSPAVSSAQEWQAWETASNASQSSTGARLSTARTRFGAYLDKLNGSPELTHAITALLQPTRPRIDTARRILSKLTATESYLKSKSTLMTNITYLANELRELREAVADGQERSFANGALLQDVVEQQGTVVMETAEMAKGTLYNIERVRLEAREHNERLGNTFVERLNNIYTAAHATYTAVYTNLQHYDADAQLAARERQTQYGHEPVDGQHVHMAAGMDASQSRPGYNGTALHSQHWHHGMDGVSEADAARFGSPEAGRDGAVPNGSLQRIAATRAAPVRAGASCDDGWVPGAAPLPPGVSREPSAVSPASDRSAGADGLYIEDEWLCADDRVERSRLPSGPGLADAIRVPESGWNEAGDAESANDAESDWNPNTASPEGGTESARDQGAVATVLAEPGRDDDDDDAPFPRSVESGDNDNAPPAELEDSGWGESYDPDVLSPDESPGHCTEQRVSAGDIPVAEERSCHDTSAGFGESLDNADSTHGEEFESTKEFHVHTSPEPENTPLIGRRYRPGPATSPSEGLSLHQLSDATDSVDSLADYIGRQQALQTSNIRDILASHLDAIRSMHLDHVRELEAARSERCHVDTSPPTETDPVEASNPQAAAAQECGRPTNTASDDGEEDVGALSGESGTKAGKNSATNGFGALANGAYLALYYVSQFLEIS